MNRTLSHKTLRRSRRMRWHRWYLRADGLTNRERATLGAIRGHRGHLWWVTGEREIGRRA